MNSLRQLARRIRKELRFRLNPPTPRPIIEYVEDGITYLERGERFALMCPLTECVMFNGMSFGPKGYHPFVDAADELHRNPFLHFKESRLARYYNLWQPTDAGEALLVNADLPSVLRKFPAYVMPEPWSHDPLAIRQAWVEKTMAWESSSRSGKPLGPADGHGLQGPVSIVKGEIELERIRAVLKSIEKHGFDRRRGEMHMQILKRGLDYRYRLIHGHHRTAVLAVLGKTSIPICPAQLVDIDQVQDWPQVQSGLWSKRQAADYFHHHFDFDSAAWARSLGLRH